MKLLLTYHKIALTARGGLPQGGLLFFMPATATALGDIQAQHRSVLRAHCRRSLFQEPPCKHRTTEGIPMAVLLLLIPTEGTVGEAKCMLCTWQDTTTPDLCASRTQICRTGSFTLSHG